MIRETLNRIQGFYKNDSEGRNDSGFGNTNVAGYSRFINKDGSVNVKRSGVKQRDIVALYQRLLMMSWPRFLFWVLLFYFLMNVLFACLYYFIGMENFLGSKTGNANEEFIDAFFFSSQTITTLGYGRLAPESFWASAVAAIESMIGLLGFALATGLMYGRFSRPQARIVFSEQAIVAPYKNINGLMLRAANRNRSELIECQVEVMLTMFNPQVGKREFHNLNLELNTINFLALTWTIVHPIDDTSPILGLSEPDLISRNAEFMIILTGFDDLFSQQVYSRTSYRGDEIAWGKKFVSMIPQALKGNIVEIDLKQIGLTENAVLNA